MMKLGNRLAKPTAVKGIAMVIGKDAIPVLKLVIKPRGSTTLNFLFS